MDRRFIYGYEWCHLNPAAKGNTKEILERQSLSLTIKVQLIPKEKTTKTNTCDDIKLKASAQERIINKMKNQHTEWKRIFVNHISSKWLIFKIYKEPIQNYSQLVSSEGGLLDT